MAFFMPLREMQNKVHQFVGWFQDQYIPSRSHLYRDGTVEELFHRNSEKPVAQAKVKLDFTERRMGKRKMIIRSLAVRIVSRGVYPA